MKIWGICSHWKINNKKKKKKKKKTIAVRKFQIILLHNLFMNTLCRRRDKSFCSVGKRDGENRGGRDTGMKIDRLNIIKQSCLFLPSSRALKV